jgi:hypothetical protein
MICPASISSCIRQTCNLGCPPGSGLHHPLVRPIILELQANQERAYVLTRLVPPISRDRNV